MIIQAALVLRQEGIDLTRIEHSPTSPKLTCTPRLIADCDGLSCHKERLQDVEGRKRWLFHHLLGQIPHQLMRQLLQIGTCRLVLKNGVQVSDFMEEVQIACGNNRAILTSTQRDLDR